MCLPRGLDSEDLFRYTGVSSHVERTLHVLRRAHALTAEVVQVHDVCSALHRVFRQFHASLNDASEVRESRSM